MSIEEALLSVQRGSVTAPAGCGKTQLIAAALHRHQGRLPILVLTHTNAGVSALRLRLNNTGVPASAYRVATIDGFAKRVAATFPRRSGINPLVLELANPGGDYPAIRAAAIAALEGRHLDSVLSATYSRLFVDEYQDCSLTQHRIVSNLAFALPVCVLGDPMQAIFGFAEPLVDWQADVLPNYPSVGELNDTWRWTNVGAADLGGWLLEVRRALEAGQKIDVRTLPHRVEYVHVPPGQDDIRRQVALRARAETNRGSVLVIADSRNVSGRHQLASQTPGATVVESVDLRDLTSFGRLFDPTAADATSRLLIFAGSLMTNLAVAQTLQRLDSIRIGRARNPPTEAEAALLAFERARTLHSARQAIVCLRGQSNVRVYRHEVLERCLRAMSHAADGHCSFHEATVLERERFRQRGRPLASRNIGSTLLLKGLEAEVAAILHPEQMDARNLYVALSRASHRIIVCSTTPILPA
ncbi:MAG: UvrD-helicase domain-containing protein [Mizugakiibacter sp.]|uniref:UvrD-helicase domain-containing protein n=1 Tax=Mizugakiibacter sp. TaxID=1972610 RepID=UPI0031C46403|nr:UvrD-helicase domain-containing protein [Xanthomonadaceae bacterium]